DRAIEYFKRAIASNKGYAEAYGHLGRLYLRLDRLDEAVRLLQEAVSIRADFAYGYNALAIAYARLGLRNEAVVAIQKAIERERLAYYLAKAARHQEAHTLFAELAHEAPRAALEVNDGIALAGLGNDEAAIAAYERALALDPKEDRAQLYRGNAFLRLGRRVD